ncbi:MULTISPECIES: STAS domain-containing protein [unclassified Agarivorans]|uniref:STAS domain-containing protein n=1 Tax=unclassified Agarivorans TaxID=2636026 RepID=UPI0026E1FF12|nr:MULTISPECIES: STAS domain-containing protein [unclassified Agarivorans]MDO6687005.1 STAS domain-containing protein [Agarivorans sp. 3_MG-2023]MDO6713583.1 STAS domain-containing protein [Agarivorans sp. 2_MG-2023]
MNMQLTTSDQGDVTASINGAFDAKSCAQHKNQFENICHQAASKLVIVNLAHVDFLDASGIGALVFMFKRINAAGGRLIIVGAQQQPRDLLVMLRVNHIITMLDTLPNQPNSVDTLPSIAA